MVQLFADVHGWVVWFSVGAELPLDRFGVIFIK